LPPYMNEELELQELEVLAMRGDEEQSLEVLVKWKNLPECENSWELLGKMKESFPDFHLEDKVNFKGGSVDKYKVGKRPNMHIHNVYERRKWKPITWGPQYLSYD